jgi:hypothetical protein
MSNLTDELTKLAELRDRGILSDAEFDAQKAQLLQTQMPPASSPPPATPASAVSPAATQTQAAPVYNPVPAAPAVATPTPSAGRPEEQLMRAFVGPNADFYLGKWRTMEAQAKPYSWNWAAFLLSIYWMAYRKMFQPALIAAGAVLLLVIVGMLMPAIAALTNILVLVVAGGVGWRGNTLYRDHVRRSLTGIEAANHDPQARFASAQAQGGVSMPAALGLLAVWLVVVGGLSYFQVVRAQAALATANAFSPLGGTAATAPGAGTATTSPTAYPPAAAGSAYAPAGTTPAAAEWVIGQWGPVSSPPCTSWMRLSADHTLSDNAGATGTWSLTPGSGGADTLVVSVTGQAPNSGPVVRGAGNTMVMGTAPRTITWQQEQC